MELEAANDSLTRLVAARDMLLVEVNHRAKNSLAIAASLLAIQGRRQPDQAVKALFEEAQSRLNAMARVHDLLSKSERSQRVDVATYVTDLCEALRPITESDDRIRLEAEVETGILVEAATAVPLGIVLTELVTNAVKYAFPDLRSGTIRVQVRRGQQGWVEVLIRDDGIGFDPAKGRNGGHGLTGMRERAKALGAELTIDSVRDNGTEVEIVLPMQS